MAKRYEIWSFWCILWPISSIIMAILGHFSRFSTDDYLDLCLSDQQEFTESTLVLYCLRYRILRLNILKNRKNGHNMHENGHIWYFLAIFVGGTFRPLSEHASCLTDALVSPVWKNCESFIARKMTKNLKNGHSKCNTGNFGPFFEVFTWWSFRHMF